MVFVLLICWGPFLLAFIVAIPIYIPWPVHTGFFFSTPWATLVVSCVLKLSHSDRCEVRSHSGNVYRYNFQPFQRIPCLSHLVMETQTGSFLEISQVRRGGGKIENLKFCCFFFQYMKFVVILVSIQHAVLIPKGTLLNTHHPPSLPSHPHRRSVCSQFLRVSHELAIFHSNLFFFSFPSPMGFC